MRRRIITITLLALILFGAASVVPLAQEDQPPGPDAEAAVEDAAAQEAEEAEEADGGARDEEAAEEANGGEDTAARDEPADEEAGDGADTAARDEDEWEMPALPDDLLEDDIFIPTEEISADEEVTFPVNI